MLLLYIVKYIVVYMCIHQEIFRHKNLILFQIKHFLMFVCKLKLVDLWSQPSIFLNSEPTEGPTGQNCQSNSLKITQSSEFIFLAWQKLPLGVKQRLLFSMHTTRGPKNQHTQHQLLASAFYIISYLANQGENLFWVRSVNAGR